MSGGKAADFAERIRNSAFSQDVVGPRVARPLASWLSETFPAEAEADSATTDSAPDTAHSAELSAAATDLDATDLDATGLDATGLATAEDGAASDPLPANGIERSKQVLAALKERVKDHNLVVVAAGIAFWGLLAIPALLFATVSIAGLVLDPATVKEEVNSNLGGLPKEARTIIGDQLANVSSGSTGGLITGLVVGILLALWTTSGAMAKLMNTLNTIYGTTEGRKFLKLRGTAILLTLGGIVFISAAIFLLAALPAVLGEIDGLGDSAAVLFNVLRFPALAAVMVVGLGVLYHVGPDRHERRYRVFTLGALVATLLWIGLSALFTIYTATAGSYNETYGSLGGLVVLLLWLFITGFVVLIGAEVHALTGRDFQNSTRSDDVAKT